MISQCQLPDVKFKAKPEKERQNLDLLFMLGLKSFWVVVSKIFMFIRKLGKIPILTNIFELG